MAITPKPPSVPGVYLFLDPQDRIMYVGMAHDLENVLYRYAHLEGRQKMRDRAADGLIGSVVWFSAPDRAIPPTLESVLITRHQPPWNTQHNPTPRNTEEAVPLSEAEAKWIENAADRLHEVVAELGGPSTHPRSRPVRSGPPPDRYGRSTCRDLVLESMIDLELKTGRTQFKLDRVVKNAMRISDTYPETTLRTFVSSIMCADAPAHHTNHTNDLRRVSRGVYQRINRD